MKKLFFLFTSCFTYLAMEAQISLNVVDFGAVGNGSTLNTVAIQQAIDSCNSAGGGEVIIPSGTFKSNTIILKSNITLRVAGTLLAITGLGNYPEHPFNQPSWSDNYTKKSLIFAEEAHNIRITGGGTINGQGLDVGVYLESVIKNRPHGIRIHKCTGVIIDSIRLQSAPQWMVHIQRSDSVTIRAVTVSNLGFGQNDGIDIDACKHVLIEDCDVDSDDDDIVVKSHSEDESSNILIRRCTLSTFERGVKVGNESLGPFKNVRFEDITLKLSPFPLTLLPQTAIYLAITDGGSADSIAFERIHVLTPYQTPIFIRLNDRGNSYLPGNPHPPVQFLKNVLIKDVECTAGSDIPCSITAIPGYYVENIRLQNISITVPGGGPSAVVPVPENATGRPENDMWGTILPAYGFYVRHAKNVTFDNVCFTLQSPDPRPEYWLEDTLGVSVVNECSWSSARNILPLSPSITVYPNPAENELFISGEEGQGRETLSVFDATGKFYAVKVWWSAPQRSISLAALSPGMYWVQVENDKGEKRMRSFVKQ